MSRMSERKLKSETWFYRWTHIWPPSLKSHPAPAYSCPNTINWEGSWGSMYLSPAFQNKSKGLNLCGSHHRGVKIAHRTEDHSRFSCSLITRCVTWNKPLSFSFCSYNGVRCGVSGRQTPGFLMSGFSLTFYSSCFPHLFLSVIEGLILIIYKKFPLAPKLQH